MLSLIETRTINETQIDGYFADNKAFFTREQVGSALEYSNPQKAIDNIHARHKDRLDPLSVTLKLRGADSKEYDTSVYCFKGVMEICRWSRQPKADMVMDALYDMAESVIQKGYFSVLSDKQLLEMLEERADKQIDSARILKEARRSAQTEQIRQLWIRRFVDHEDISISDELRTICMGDTALYHKYFDRYYADEQREKKGQIVLF